MEPKGRVNDHYTTHFSHWSSQSFPPNGVKSRRYRKASWQISREPEAKSLYLGRKMKESITGSEISLVSDCACVISDQGFLRLYLPRLVKGDQSAMRWFFEVLLTVFCAGVISASERPHVVVMVVDDAGWNDFGFHGTNQVKTPNIDALAYSGMILNRHYVLPSCTPSRAALLTGYYPIHSGLQGYPLKAGENRNLPLSFKLAPERFKGLGYATHLVGKWHLGYETFNYVPNHRGFDTFFGYYNGYIDYYSYEYNQLVPIRSDIPTFHGYDMHWNDDVLRVKKPVYATKLFLRRTQNIIRAHDPSEPLYLYLPHLATHTGNESPRAMQYPEEMDVNGTYSYIKHYGRRGFAGCLEELDRAVGVVIKELNEKNMLNNSIIVIMSDNGAHTVSVDMSPNWGSNWPLRGTKFTLYEGGVRGAALIWSPFLPKGVINNSFMHIKDWLPTLYSAAGGNVKDLGNIDGIDQWKALQNVETVHTNNILLNIDERVGLEGVIINNRWKVVKGGFANYANYDHHWGEEENVGQVPKYDPDAVLQSDAGRAVQSLLDFHDVLTDENMIKLRREATLKCEKPPYKGVHVNGEVRTSQDFVCKEYCVFDILKDPCELHDLKDERVIKTAMQHLNKYRQGMMPQKDSKVAVDADPHRFGGVWMPWKTKGSPKSTAEELALQCLSVSLFITLSWYSVRVARSFV